MGSPLRSPKSRLVRFASTSTGFCPVSSSSTVFAFANGSPPAPNDILTTTFEMKIWRMMLSFLALGFTGAGLEGAAVALAFAEVARFGAVLGFAVLVVFAAFDMLNQPPEWKLKTSLHQGERHIE